MSKVFLMNNFNEATNVANKQMFLILFNYIFKNFKKRMKIISYPFLSEKQFVIFQIGQGMVIVLMTTRKHNEGHVIPQTFAKNVLH